MSSHACSRLVLFLAACVSSLTPTASTWAEPVNLLFFGNSFTDFNPSMRVYNIVSDLAVADGYEAPNVAADIEAGRDLDFHLVAPFRVDSGSSIGLRVVCSTPGPTVGECQVSATIVGFVDG